jgi:quercetin dioxygenase-like cupin family protein
MSDAPHPVIRAPGEGVWLSFHGIPSRIVATGDETGDSFCVSVGTSSPGGKAPPHAHGFGEGFWITEGTMNFTAGNRKVELPEGGFIHIRGSVAHFPENETDAEAELITICTPAGFDRFQLEVGERVKGSDGPFPKADSGIGERMRAAAETYGIDLSPPPEAFEKEPEITVRQPGEGDVIAVVGDVYRFLVKGEDTDGAYALWHASVYPGGGPPPHRHAKEDEFFYLLKGEVTIYDDGQPFLATPGTAITLPRGTRHWFKNEGSEPAEMLILVAPAGLEDMFQKTGRPWSAHRGAPGEPRPGEIAILKQIAGDYGIEFG